MRLGYKTEDLEMTEPTNELDQLQQEIYQNEKMENMLSSLRAQLREQQIIEVEYESELEKEQIDVEKINKKSISSIFYSMLGSREKQIEKECQEALSAQLKYDEIKRQIEDTRNQISRLEKEKMEYDHSDNDYHTLYQQKYQDLKQSKSVNIEKVSEIEKSISLYKVNIREIEHAISAGNLVLVKLDGIVASLGNAENWGVWDVLGSGLDENTTQYSNIDDARSEVSEVQSLLNQFCTEITDVKVSSNLDLGVDGFVKFADFFFDGLISDWVVQSCIEDSLESVKKVSLEVNIVLIELKQMKKKEKEKLTQKSEELDRMIKGNALL